MPWIEQDGNRIYYARLDAPPALMAAPTASPVAFPDRRLAGEGREGSKTPVILHHGLAQWGEDWATAGWPDVFGDRNVFALDALGHGRSDRPCSNGPAGPADAIGRAAYSVGKRAEAVLRIADAEQLDRFIFFGFSMGGRVGFELAVSEPLRVERLIVGGMHGLKPSIDRDNLERRIAVLRSPKWRMVERAVGARPGDGRDNDQEALALSTEAVLDWAGAEDRLPASSVNTLLFCGAQDSLLGFARQTAALIPGCTLAELPSTTHAASFYSSGSAREQVRDFLSA